MNFILSSIQETNPQNTAMHDYLVGLADMMQAFWLTRYDQQTHHEPTSEITLNRIANHVKFSVRDLETNDVISGFAVISKH